MLHRAAGFTVRKLRNELRELGAERDRVHEGLDPTQTAKVERNRQFVPVDGYAFAVYSDREAEGADNETSSISARVFLEEVELQHVTTEFGARYEISDASVVDRTYPVALSLRVDVE